MITIRVFYYRKNRTIKVESTKNTFQLWEENDGYHSMNDEAILKEKNNRFAPKIVFYENIISPLGSSETESGINKLVTLINLVKKGGGEIGISTKTSRFLEWITSHTGYVIIGMCFLLALYYGTIGA